MCLNGWVMNCCRECKEMCTGRQSKDPGSKGHCTWWRMSNGIDFLATPHKRRKRFGDSFWVVAVCMRFRVPPRQLADTFNCELARNWVTFSSVRATW